MAADPALADNAGRVRQEAAIDAALAEWCGGLTAAEVIAQLEAARVPVGPIYSVADMVSDPHFQARGLFETVEVDGEPLKIPAIMPRLEGTPGRTDWPGGGVGSHNGEILGGVLGLSAFTTYNWLTQFDSLEAYLTYPVSVADVFRAKRIAFVLVGSPTVAVPYLAAVVWFEATLLDAVVGAILLAGYALYYYGLTVYIAGFDPNEFLFDAVRFATFTVGVAVALVPTLVAGFVVVPPSLELAAALSVGGVVMGVVGIVLSSRAGPRWERRYRRE